MIVKFGVDVNTEDIDYYYYYYYRPTTTTTTEINTFYL